MQDAHCLEFDAFRLDFHDERLWRGHEAVHLHPKTFAVLACLMRQAGQLVTKDALLAAVWPETVVSESVITVAMRQLRRVLGDRARAPHFIETVHGRGYRFIAPVSVPAPPGRPEAVGVSQGSPPALFRRPLHFVGREAALAQLAQWWTTARQGTRQVGVIAGEPGIGKSALVEAFVAQEAAGGACWVAHGQCSEPYGPGEPYRPLLEALGRLCRHPAGAQLVAVLRQYAPSWLVQMPALLPSAEWDALQRTVGHAVEPRMLRELTDALDVVTTERPLVLILEDLHWSDRATLAWLAAVARRPDPARLLLLGTYRPVDAIVHAHPLRFLLAELRQHGQCGDLALDYLSDAAITAYLDQRFGAPPWAAVLARGLRQRTNGNPLFLIAVVDELVRQQVVTEGPAGWVLQGRVETIPTIVPAHLQALIEHQLAHCSPEDQTLLAVASVAGSEFAAAAVAAGLERPDEETEARCAALAHQGRFLQAHGSAEWPDGTVTACYGFVHVLYHDVVYQRIPVGRQTRWHARIGIRLAQGFGAQGGDMAVAVAQHCVRGRLRPQAVQYLGQAGQQAAQRGAHQEAVAFYEQALHTLQQLPTTPERLAQAIDLHLALDHPLSALGAYGRRLALLGEAEALARGLDDHARLGWVLAHMAHVLRITGDSDGAIAAGQQAFELAVALGESALQGLASYTLGQAYYAIDDFGRAAELLRWNVEAAGQGAGRPGTDVRIESRAWLARTLSALGDFAEGQRHGEEALRLATREGRGSAPLIAHGCLGELYLATGDLGPAIRVLEQGLALCRASGNGADVRVIAAALGSAYVLQGRLAEGRALLEEAINASLRTGALRNHARRVTALSEVCRLAGRCDEAWQHARQALALARQLKERSNEALALRQLGAVQAHAGPPDVEQAATYYQQALALAEELGMRPLQAHCHLGLGTLYATLGRREPARAALATAIALYRAMDMTFWLPQAEAVLAQVGGRG